MTAQPSILVVTGAHLAAENRDRPIAYRLKQQIVERWGSRHEAPAELARLDAVVVCSDLWYLNREELRALPTVSVGGPEVNALSAYLADKLPSALAIDGVLLVQADATFESPIAACWGIDASATAQAVEAFSERYLDSFLDAALEW